MTGRRDPYVDVGRAVRAAVERAANERLPRACHQTLEAVIAAVASYSRLEDDVSIEQLAAAAHLHPKTVEQALHRLRALDIVVYRGGRGRGNVSRVGLPAAPENGATRDSVFAREKGAVSGGKGSRLGPKRESLRLPTREVSREESRGSGSAAPSAPPLIDDECMQCGTRAPCRDDGERILCLDCGGPTC